MEIVINPKYRFLHKYLEHISEHFADGEPVQQSFNEIRVLRTGDLTLTVKRYGRSLTHRLKFYKTAKGKRAFLGQRLLRERGYESPEPVAFVRYRRNLLTADTYFVTVRSPLRHILSDLSPFSESERQDIVTAFAAYTKRLHEDGFIHHNYKSKHVIFDRAASGEGWRFALIDVNRVHRRRKGVSVERGLKGLARITFDDDSLFLLLVDEYVRLRAFNPDEARRIATEAHTAYQNKVARRGR